MNKLESPPSNSALFRREQIEQAHKYNKALSSGAVYRANENVAQGDGSVSDDSMVYEELLDATDTGFMGRIRYDELNIDLPIYHGTSDETLLRGVGHLEGTSLPVGGKETRSVLTAHRGLPESTLFTNLNNAAVGDRFTVSVLDQTLTYEVIEMLVIEPDETEAILPVANTDMLTLITCTPLGINSHRILVNAVRVTPTPIADEVAATAVPDLPGFPWWSLILGGVFIGAVLFVWWSGYAHAARLARAAARAERNKEATDQENGDTSQ
ncbi:MAG TPA: class C sortase [Glutamicibacter sp.]|nr:class C sortase [Glutamicibacter sp.]